MQVSRRRYPRAACALALAVLIVAAQVGAVPASGLGEASAGPETVLVDGTLSATALSVCGQVELNLTLSNTPTALSRLPVSVYASEPTRGFARTLIRTFSSPSDLNVNTTSAPLFTASPSGVGPALVVEMTWAGGSVSTLTNTYYNNCPGTFFGLTPTRLLDTRVGIGVGTSGKVAAGSVTEVDPAAIAGVPAQRVTALAANLTATEADTAGYLTVYPCSVPTPASSNVNFAASQTLPNFALIDLIGHPNNGKICIFSSTSTHVIIDVTGYVLNDQDPLPTGGRYNALSQPQRLIDTRNVSTLAAGETRRVGVAAAAGIPASGVSGAALNVTAVNGDGAGYLTVFPCGTTPPIASTVNYAGAAPTPNATIVGLSGDGGVCVYAFTRVDIVVDVTGYFAATGSNLIGGPGIRLVDTRPSGVKLAPGVPTVFHFGVPGQSQLLNVVITEADVDGYATVYSCDVAPPNASNLNFVANQTVANGAFVRVTNAGTYCILSTQSAYVIVDVTGFATNPTRAPADAA